MFERVPDGDPTSRRLGDEVRILREGVDHRRLDRRYQSALERDAIEQADDALRN